MDASHAATYINSSRPFWGGLAGGIGSALGLMLCNHDGYHFPWLTGLCHPLLIFSCVAVSLPLIPASLRTSLLAKRADVFSIPFKVHVFAFFWVVFFFGVGFFMLMRLQGLRETGLCNRCADGSIVATAQTMSRGGPVDWAVYSFVVEGGTLTSAHRMEPGEFRPGQTVRVRYTGCWPRHSRPFTVVAPGQGNVKE